MVNKCRFCATKTEREDGVCRSCANKYESVRRFTAACEQFKRTINYGDICNKRDAANKVTAEELYKIMRLITVDDEMPLSILFPASQLHQICEQLAERGVTVGKKG